MSVLETKNLRQFNQTVSSRQSTAFLSWKFVEWLLCADHAGVCNPQMLSSRCGWNTPVFFRQTGTRPGKISLFFAIEQTPCNSRSGAMPGGREQGNA
jgi:hypothetical protein